jgi:nucleoside-diphosphate-sugar epimerase
LAIKISELLQTIARLTRFEGEVRWQHDKPEGQPPRRLDVSRAFDKFGFQAQVPVE